MTTAKEQKAEKHTSGPWDFGIRKDGSMWLSLGDHKKTGAHYQGDLVASVPDAHLICAAPDLLAALIFAQGQVALLGGTPDPEDRFADALQVAVQREIRAAIQRATGEQK